MQRRLEVRCSIPRWLVVAYLYACAMFLLAGGEKLQAHPSTLFPIPEVLRPNVAFWIQIFTALDSRSGVLHDATDVTIIYHTLRNLPEDLRQRRHQIERYGQHYTDILLELAQGKRDHLSQDAVRVLALFKGQPTAEALRAATTTMRFQLGLKDRFAEGLARSGAYLPTIRRTFADAGLPPELVVLPHVESSFNNAAYSKAGAVGMWQFTHGTGQRFLRIDRAIDERFDFRLATVAAAKLLHENYQELGTWPLAITAYNHGVYGMKRAIAELGTRDFGTIVQRYKSRSFGFASKNFYAEFLAVLEIVTNRHKYFNEIRFDPPQTYHTMTLDAFMSLQTLAQHLRVDAQDLARWNPALRQPVVQGKQFIPKGVVLYIPHQQVKPAEVRIRLAKIPTQDKFAEQPHGGQYRIASGDTLSRLAQRFRTSVETLMQLNDLEHPDQIKVGYLLRLPPVARTHVVAAQTAPPTRTATALTAPPTRTKVVAADSSADPSAFMPYLTSSSVSNSHLAFHLLMAGFPVNELQAPDIEQWLQVHDGTIRVIATETLELYASWLEVSTQHLRALNRLGRRSTLRLGTRVRLDFAKVSETLFTMRRWQHHRDLEENFFRSRTVDKIIMHTLQPGETLWTLSRREYAVPLWLLQKYNHDLEFRALPPGTKLRIPQVVEKEL